MSGKKRPPPQPAEPSARAPDLATMARALKRTWPLGVMADIWERMREARRQAYADHARTRTSRRCPCGLAHSLAEVCR